VLSDSVYRIVRFAQYSLTMTLFSKILFYFILSSLVNCNFRAVVITYSCSFTTAMLSYVNVSVYIFSAYYCSENYSATFFHLSTQFNAEYVTAGHSMNF